MSLQAVGLIVFAITVGVNVAGLTLDAALYSHQLPTVTDFCRRNAWATALIMAVNIIGLIGLAIHFSNGDVK